MPLINQNKAKKWTCSQCKKHNEFVRQRDWCKKCGRIHWIDENENVRLLEAAHAR